MSQELWMLESDSDHPPINGPYDIRGQYFDLPT
jgi:hypothetical protein